ncbi:phage virion morphogenesis protein [Nitrosospira lacus]|nr:phage virion morphogenesis protein [Nitrosospira lacus]
MRGLDELIRRGGDLSGPLAMIGEKIADSTMDRFGTSRGPDGQAWAPNSHLVIRQLLERKPGAFSRRTGGLTEKGKSFVAGKKPLVGETRSLSTTIRYQLLGRDAVVIGSSMIYAGTHQFGARKGAFGKTRRGAHIPWGNIPARPFLGISEQDRGTIIDVINDYLTGSNY